MTTFARHYLESFGVKTDSMTDGDVTQEFRNLTLFLRNKLLDEHRRDSLYTSSEVGYINSIAVQETCVRCRNYIPGGSCVLVGGRVEPSGTCQLWEPWAEPVLREDGNEPTKKVINWNGLRIGITHEAGNARFGYPLRGVSYGRIYRTYGQAEDGRAIDCWVGPDLESGKAFWFQQLDPEDGSPDELKLVIGFPDRLTAKNVLQDNLPLYLRDAMFGGLFEVSPVELDVYRAQPRTDAEGRYSHINFTPPESVRRAARRGLELRKAAPKSRKGGLSNEQASQEGIGSGVQRAVNLSNGTTLSPQTVKRMKAFFDRHSAFKSKHETDPPNKSYISWLLWGGDAGHSWSKKVVAQMEAADRKDSLDAGDKLDDESLELGDRSSVPARSDVLSEGSDRFFVSKVSDRVDSSRPSCLICVEKHLSNSLILADEISQGYPQFRLLLIGNLSQAADEAVVEYPDLAEQIRDMRHRFQVEGIMPTVDEVYELLQPYYAGETEEGEVVGEVPGFVEDSASVGAPARILEDVEPEVQKEEFPRFRKKKSRPKKAEDDERSDARKIWVPAKGDRDGYWRTDPRTKKVEPVSQGSAFLSNRGLDTLGAARRNSDRSMNPTYWVTDRDGQDSLLKFHNSVDSAREILASEIAIAAGIPCQWVRGIPAELIDRNPIKGVREDGSATLHKLVPGESVESLLNRGQLPSQYRGLELSPNLSLPEILKNPDLARIAALDVALGNPDRHEGNLFYDKPKDRFYAIDNGCVLYGSYNSVEVRRQIQDAYTSHQFKNFTPEERSNLSIFGMTLDRISRSNPPESISRRLNRYTQGMAGSSYDSGEVRLRVSAITAKMAIPIAAETARIIKEGLK